MKENSFGDFLRTTRIKKEVTGKELGAGLCSESLITKIERGERFPDKSIRDRLLARLGECGYEFENFLQPQEYEDWRKREELLEELEKGNLRQAEELLEDYYSAGKKDKVLRQFYLAMKLQLLELGYGKQEKKAEYLTEAVYLTIPWSDGKKMKSMLLSIEELNLVLEYVACTKPFNEEERYIELLGYLKEERFDEECRAMLTSKVAYYYCSYLWEKLVLCTDAEERIRIAGQALVISDEGMESLRNNERLYFAWELFQKEADFLEKLLSEGEQSPKVIRKLKKRKKWNRDFFLVLDWLYEEFCVSKRTCAYTYFYQEYEIYCISDVLRARRKMLGYGKGDFEEDGKCTYRSVCRIEAGKTEVQRALAKHMLEKLNLSAALQRGQVITDSQQALRIEKEYRNAMNQRAFGKAERLLQKLKKMLPKEILINHQYIEQNECDLDFFFKRINREEYVTRLKMVLELTVPMESVLCPIQDKRLQNGSIQKGEKYFTNREIQMLVTLSKCYGDRKDNPYIPMLLEYYRQFEAKGSTWHMCNLRGFVLAYVESYLGNIGDYESSDKICQQLLKDELRVRRIGRVDHLLYSLMWNKEQRMINSLSVRNEPNRQACLKKCLILTDFCKDKMRNQWMSSKLQEIKETV